MALLAVEGTYKDGKVELAETPEGVEAARVMVVFVSVEPAVPGKSKPTDEERRSAGERLIARMRKGYHLGGERPYPLGKREELYADRLKRFEKG
jgi:hypothetical protein